MSSFSVIIFYSISDSIRPSSASSMHRLNSKRAEVAFQRVRITTISQLCSASKEVMYHCCSLRGGISITNKFNISRFLLSLQ